jgi:transposase, IS5 family
LKKNPKEAQMLTDRYDPVDLFTHVPGLRLQMEPMLAQLDALLDDDFLFRQVRADLARRHPHTLTRGRRSTPVEVVLRMLVVMRLYRWSFEEAEYWVNDSLVLRQFCRVYLQPVPDDTTLIRWASLIGEQTLAALNERVVQMARQLKVTRGRKLRVDTTVVPTNIHHPTDSALLGDGVRVLSRLLRRARRRAGQVPALAALAKEVFRTRSRACRRLAQQFHRLARKKGSDGIAAMKQADERQLAVTRASVRPAQRVVAALAKATPAAAGQLQQQFERFLPLVEQAIQQAWRRVIVGEAVPAPEKVVSLFEPHTQIITRHKAGRPVEFGRKLWLDEVEGGIVSRWKVLQEGGGTDQPYLAAALQSHRERFGKPPHLLAADRGVSSPENERLAQEAGVRRVVLPCNGRASPQRKQQEHSGWFRRGFRFRAGIEGRVHVLQRDFGRECCLYHGEEGLGRWVGWGIVVHNLVQIGRTVTARPAA